MTTTCPRCGRAISVSGGRFMLHDIAPTAREEHCPMSKQTVPITGVSPIDYYRRASLVADLATQVQDGDPAIVWDYLTALPAEEMQRLLVIALAGIDGDKTINEIWSWVLHLPVARAS